MNSLGVSLGIAALAAGLAMSRWVDHKRATRSDRRIERFARGLRTEQRTDVARALAFLGSPKTTAVAAAALTPVARSPGRALLSIALRPVLEMTSKAAFQRRRPVPRHQIGVKRGSSLPSGHALDVASLVLLARALFPKSKLAVGGALAVGCVIGASRVYLGKHHPTDVAAGLLLGAGAATLVDRSLG